MIIQPSFGGCLHLRIAIPVEKNILRRLPASSDCHCPLIKPFSIGMRQRAVHRKKPSSIGMRQRAVHRKNRRRAVSYVSTGLARLPRDTSGARNYRRSAVVEKPSPRRPSSRSVCSFSDFADSVLLIHPKQADAKSLITSSH